VTAPSFVLLICSRRACVLATGRSNNQKDELRAEAISVTNKLFAFPALRNILPVKSGTVQCVDSEM
jgi:hypothetical protein